MTSINEGESPRHLQKAKRIPNWICRDGCAAVITPKPPWLVTFKLPEPAAGGMSERLMGLKKFTRLNKLPRRGNLWVTANLSRTGD